jgi:hypothetical protein
MPSHERTSTPKSKGNWESWERDGTVILSCKKCNYRGEVRWDLDAAESGEWRCPQCECRWPFLDFDRLWIAPAREIEYRGSVDLLAPLSPEFSSPTLKARAWRQSDEDFEPCFLHSDPESQDDDDFGWGLCRYAAERLPSLNLAFAILYDFYGWLSWADSEISDAPYSQKRWAQHHAPAFLGQTIVHLPRGKPWTISDADMQSALRPIVPASFPRGDSHLLQQPGHRRIRNILRDA